MGCIFKQTYGKLANPQDIKLDQIKCMYKLFSQYYDNADFKRFQSDLKEKDKIILVKHKKNNKIVGFTTIQLKEVKFDNTTVFCLFSGDTILDKKYRGEGEIQKVWLKYALDLAKLKKTYWVLISKGHKTYRLLPRYFKKYYPNHITTFPKFEKNIMDTFISSKFGDEYEKKLGIIRYKKIKDYLKKEDAFISHKDKNHPSIKFFLKMNPEYKKGDELVCIVKLSLDNLNLITKLFYKFNFISIIQRFIICLKRKLSN